MNTTDDFTDILNTIVSYFAIAHVLGRIDNGVSIRGQTWFAKMYINEQYKEVMVTLRKLDGTFIIEIEQETFYKRHVGTMASIKHHVHATSILLAQ